MDIFEDCEVVFTDTFATKPLRTLIVNTNAPLHSISANVPSSSGLASFPADSPFCDRFIVWRTVGQKLYMEERSICRTVTLSTLCLDFSRTAILSGTSITLINQAILCIVVPTQSTVHRFFARLLVDHTHQSSDEVPSIFVQIDEREFLNDNHTSHLLTTSGHALRASVLLLRDTTKIAYCMADGQLVIVTMPTLGNSKCEEAVFRERGLFKRILGSGNDGGIGDVAGLLNEIGPQTAGSPGDVFYAVYKDGMVRAWNTETQVPHTYQLKISEGAQINAVGIRSYRLGDEQKHAVVFVSVSTTLGTVFYALRDHNRKLTLMNTVSAENLETLLDFGVLNSTKEEYDGSAVRLFAMWSSATVTNEYIVKHVTFVLSNTDEQRDTEIRWRTVKPVAPRDSTSVRVDSGVAELRENVFSLDAHPFDVVYRATQIVCQGMRCERSSYNWATLAAHIDNYLRSPEFDANYKDRKGAIRLSAKDSQTEAEKKFFLALSSACDQLESAGRAPLGLAILDVPGASFTGVIQQDRFSVIREVDADLLELLSLIEPELIERVIMEAKQKQKSAETSSSSDSDEERGSGAARNRQGSLGLLTINQPPAKLIRQWINLMNAFVDVSAVDRPEVSDKVNDCSFNGSFTTGLISASLRHIVKQRLAFADDLLLVDSMMQQDKNARVKDHKTKTIVQGLQTLRSNNLYVLSVLDIKLSQEFAQVSLGSWLFSDEGLAMVRCEGGADGTESDHDMEHEQYESQFNKFVESTVQAALRILWPTSHSLYLARKLVQHEKFHVLKNLCSVTRFPPADLLPAYRYYAGIAYSGIGQPQKAMVAFNEAVSGMMVGNLALQHALRPIGRYSGDSSGSSSSVSGNGEVGLGEFYLQALRYLVDHHHSEEVIELAKSAIAALPEGSESTSRISINLFNHLVTRGQWEDALLSIQQNKDQSVRKLTLQDLLSRMLEAKQWNMISSLQYRDLEDLVIATLLQKARGQEVTAVPHLFELIYAFHIQQDFNYEKAATAMYEFAFLLRTHPNQTPDLLKRRRDVLACVSSLLDLLPEEDRFLAFPQELQIEDDDEMDGNNGDDSTESMIEITDSNGVTQTRRPIRMSKKRTYILTHAELRDEFVLTNARATLLTSISEPPPIEPVEVVGKLIETQHYDSAFDVCRQFNIDVSDVIFAVACGAVQADIQPDVTPSWVRTNMRRAVQNGSCASPHWSVVEGLVQASRIVRPNDARPLRAALRACLRHGAAIPHWLQALYSDSDVNDYVRTLLDFGVLDIAITVMTEKIREETLKIRSVDSRTWLPYTVIDEIRSLGDKGGHETLMKHFNEALSSYLRSLKSFDTAARITLGLSG